MKFANKKLNIYLHLLAWLLLFVLPSYIIYYMSDYDSFILYHSISQAIFLPIIFYLNYLWLAPQFFFKKKRIIYFTITLVTIISLSFVFENTKHLFGTPPKPRFIVIESPEFKKFKDFPKKQPGNGFPVYNLILTGILMTGFGLGLRFSEKLSENETMRKEAEKEKIKAELAFLKNQINPHFFFNTLNNIYSLVRINTDDGQKAILQLSKLMRYLLYESDKENTSLGNEIDFLKNYIHLMQLRLSENVEVKFTFPEDKHSTSLPPLLFIPFIENAFKHGVSSINEAHIDISIQVDKNKINFMCKNNISTKKNPNQIEPHGIGLDNITKRLNLLFPTTHKLKIEEDENEFCVKLELILI